MPTFLRTDDPDLEYVQLSNVETLSVSGPKAGPMSILAKLPNTTFTLAKGLDRDIADGAFRTLLSLTGSPFPSHAGTWLIEWDGSTFTGVKA